MEYENLLVRVLQRNRINKMFIYICRGFYFKKLARIIKEAASPKSEVQVRKLSAHRIPSFQRRSIYCFDQAFNCLDEAYSQYGGKFALVKVHWFEGSVQFSSVAQSCPTLCDPMNRSTPGLPVHHHLPEFTQTHVHWVHDAIQPSHPRSSPSPPAPNPSQHQSLFKWVNSSHEVAKVLELQF